MYYKDKEKNLIKQANIQNGWSYAQVFLASVKNIVKIKEMFLNLLTKKIEEVQKMSNDQKKKKPRFNMMTKSSLKRQVLVSISLINLNKFMAMSSIYIVNINRALKSIKSDTIADFVQADQRSLTITTNKVTFMSDLNTIERYIKNVNIVNSEDVIASQLPQSKSYLKILVYQRGY